MIPFSLSENDLLDNLIDRTISCFAKFKLFSDREHRLHILKNITVMEMVASKPINSSLVSYRGGLNVYVRI